MANEAEEDIVGKKGKKNKDKGYSKNGIPRKALRCMIQDQLEKQAHTVFEEFLKDKNFDKSEDEEESKEPVGEPEHVNIECDGCGENPIKGARFKCSVCKNFDYCSTCEDRLGHEHPFLKIN